MIRPPVIYSASFKDLLDLLLQAENKMVKIDLSGMSEQELEAHHSVIIKGLYSLYDFSEKMAQAWVAKGGEAARLKLENRRRDDDKHYRARLSGVKDFNAGKDDETH